ncbi:MAG TPA: DUF1800 domain-containing protein [Candidatus Acidoferrum sp.]|nr:DUF1800 domain-containing protein [Candidatus Acidoferrum sp.]
MSPILPCAVPGLHRLDFLGTLILAAAIAIVLGASAAFAAPRAASSNAPAKNPSARIVLPQQFKGDLPITQLTEDQAILHALNRLAYGPRPGDVNRIKQMGLEKWIDRQLDPSSIDDSAFEKRLEQYSTLGMSSQQLLDDFPPPAQAAKQEGLNKDEYKQQMQRKRQQSVAEMLPTGNNNFDRANVQLARLVGPNRIIAELAMAKMDRAVYSDRQLEAVMEDFWFNHFNVYANKGADKWLLTSYVRDTIRPHTMGTFSDLLLATAKSPAMLFYLDNWLSADPAAIKQAQEQRAIRQQRYYMRFGMMPPPYGMQGANGRPKQDDRGLNENYGREVMELHTVGVDAGYTQQDVIDMAEIMTGWTIRAPRKDADFFFNERIHAEQKEVVLGRTFHNDGIKEGEKALEMLASDPHTAHHISLELAEYFVADDPPPALVDRMANEWLSSDGNIRAVLRTMIYSPEFWSKDAYRAKVKTPFELVASTARALNADVEVSLPLVQWVGRMGEPLFQCQPPTGYSDKSGMWVNSGALLNRLNFALAFGTDHLAGAEVNLEGIFGPSAGSDPNAALSQALNVFLDGEVAPATEKVLEGRLTDPLLQARLDDPVKHVNEGLVAGLVLGAPEFQRR